MMPDELEIGPVGKKGTGLSKLPPLVYDGIWPVETLVPGFIEAHGGIQFGSPCLIGTRLPTYATWVWYYLDDPKGLTEEGLTREQVIALCAFQAGVEWWQSRNRRKRFQEETTKAIQTEMAKEEQDGPDKRT